MEVAMRNKQFNNFETVGSYTCAFIPIVSVNVGGWPPMKTVWLHAWIDQYYQEYFRERRECLTSQCLFTNTLFNYEVQVLYMFRTTLRHVVIKSPVELNLVNTVWAEFWPAMRKGPFEISNYQLQYTPEKAPARYVIIFLFSLLVD